ncbi:penicillin-binding transpeptidase domain-containing protein [Crassaminicella profunda]|uniref:penicillin-binding transpeptidase domain-containing protein n=1 Tax=Crassaminicella profunda TaxID=1286698 RepID=UPI001CA5FFC9|nr:penicillin-binding transpeptidase domain-containing protein [Crassaminicella profunda]QZY56603.1 penicillin-binding protein [Crassaminicella profunda]
MLEKLKDRHNQMILFFTVFFLVLLFRLFDLSIVEGEKYKEMAEDIRMKKIPISAPRGEIKDRYGRALAVNKPSFTVQIMKNELMDEKINEVSVKLLNILMNNGENYHDNFPIKFENNKFYYTFDREIEEWLSEQGIKDVKDAEAVFNLLREQLGIDSNLDVFEVQKEMQSVHGVYPPISVKKMKFIPQMKKENFLQRYNLDENLEAKDAFIALREKFEIPESYSDEDAKKILVIRNEFREQGYRQYQPVKVALNVSAKTVAQIEERSIELPGVNVEVEPIRYYPNEGLASHILGYLGKISDSEKDKFTKELGYLPNDLIGKDGIERVYEEKLKGKDGAKYVEVDVYGRLINVLREQKPEKGKTIYLSIDAKLQETAEKALEQALKQIQVGGTFKSKWGDYRYKDAMKHATSGAVVALDVNTGDVLALANYPSFDPNLFATGISAKDWKAVQDDNPRDPLSPIPLYNVATRTSVQPGSTFKMITGLAAIENGLDPAKKLYDGGYVKLGGRTFGSWMWNEYRRSHGWVDLYKSLEESVNYYYYDVATNFDYYKNQSLNTSMNVDKMLEYAKMFGLDEPTGIEISEVASGVPNPEKKMIVTKSLLRRKLKSKAKEYFEKEIITNEEKLNEQIEKIVGWTEENPSRGSLINRVSELDVKEDKVTALVDLVKFSYYKQAKWTIGDTFNLSIGQGQHQYTPIQIARYVANIANGGYNNEVSVIKKVGNEKKDDHKGEKIALKDDNNLIHIQKGMEQVVYGDHGTARGFFRKFPVKVAAKTGSAQKSGKIQPKDEVAYLKTYLKWIAPYMSWSDVERKAEVYKKKYKNEGLAMRKAIKELSKGRVTDAVIDQYKDDYDAFGWFVSYAPSDNPQIAVVTLIFQSGTGGYGAPIAREIIAEYLGLNKEYEKVDFKNRLTN